MTEYPQANCDCYILDDLPNDALLVMYPTEYWVLHLYIIVLGQNASSQHPLLNVGNFLVLEHQSYAHHNKSIWTTPYLAYKINVGIKKYDKPLDIIKMYKDQCEKKTELLDELTNYRFYHMGISSYDIKNGREYIEYKRSPRQPDSWKCYLIKERFVHNIDSLGLKNLIDPEGLHSYRYLPIADSTNHCTLYGKPLSTNVIYLLNNKSFIRNPLIENVDLEMFRTKFCGYMLKFDIVSFTKILHEIEDNFRSFERTGVQYSETFILYLQQIFEQELMKINVSQYRLDGDGFLATMGEDYIDCDVTSCIIDTFKEISKKITGLFNGKNKLSYRASLMFGEYNYGKELGLFSKGLAHSGKELIRLTRMDSAIREHISQNKEDVPNIFFLIDKKLCNENNFSDRAISYIEDIESFRETIIDGKLFSMKMEEFL